MKYFALGWVVMIRLILLAVPIGVVLFGLGMVVGGDRSVEPVGAIFVITLTVAEYAWLGRLIAETKRPLNVEADS